MATTDLRPAPFAAAPMAPIALAVAAGIVADRWGVAWETATWAAVALGASAVAVALLRRATISSLALLVAGIAVGGGWHHARWSDLAADDLARSVPDGEGRPAWVRGVLEDMPTFRPGQRPDDPGLTRAVLEVAGLCDGRDWHAASGRVQLAIRGDRADLHAGDAVQAAGDLMAPAGPLNPGEFDYREILRAQGVRLRLAVSAPEGVWDDPEGRAAGGWSRVKARQLGALRAWSHARLVEGLEPRVAPLAAALLLGRREAVDPDVNDAFARTGTTHLLAISGLHLQVLAVAVLAGLRLLGLGRRASAGVVLATTLAYALLVGLSPSVVRSAAMTGTACFARNFDRCARPANTLALAALVTMGLNPAHLFDVGCQLSFLAVAAIVWGVEPATDAARFLYYRMTFRAQGPASPLDALERRLAPWWHREAWRRLGLVREGVMVSVVAWLATLPLVALRFHLVSPIGILLNVPLIPLTSLALMLSGVTLIASGLWAPLARPSAWLCARLLVATERIVRWGAAQSWGHAFVPGPPTWWVLAFYAGLPLALVRWSGRRPARWLVGGWTALGIILASLPHRPEAPEAEVLAVGHGLAVIVQGTDSRTILYDCGRLGDPGVGRRLIAPALWSRGMRRLEAVILSHADADHDNGLPDLLDRFAVGSVRIAPGFVGKDNPGASRLLDEVRARGIPIEPIVAGARLAVGGATLTALHPPAGWRPGAPDNDRSVVLDLDASGRHVLLTGDLDGSGLARLLASPRRPVDALLAPHHGGRSANPPDLYRWADPGVVVVSQRRPRAGTRDPLVVPEAAGIRVLRTWQSGAILLRPGASGMAATGFLDRENVIHRPPGVAIVAVGPAWMRGAVTAVGFVAGLALAMTLLVIEWGAWTLVQPGRRLGGLGPLDPPWEPVSARAADGTFLHGARRSADVPGGRTALLLHGFGEGGSAMVGRAEALRALGWDVVIPDTRGRGRSEGEHLTFGGREAGDVRAWLDALADRTGADPPTLLWGRSMGAAVALRAAVADPRITALILEAPYPDLRDAVGAWLRALRLPRALAGPILRRAERLAGVALDRPRPLDLAPTVRVPTLILHGTDDPLIPSAEARRLAAACAGPAALVEVPGARHADVFDVGGPGLADRVATFLEVVVGR